MNPNRRSLLLGTALVLAGCASPTVQDYAAERPVLDLRAYFNGPVQAWGVFTDRSGKVVKRFAVQMDCSWNGDIGTLDERFAYSDGTTQRRVWTLRKLPGGRFTGSADDVVGQAQGLQSGNAFHWTYTLSLPVDGRVWQVEMDDWMYLVSERVMLNKAVMRKFGVTLGEVTLSFLKP